MKLNDLIEEIEQKNLFENQIKKFNQIKKLFNDKVEGGFLNKKEAIALKRNIEANYSDKLEFGSKNNDIRTYLFNYDNPLLEKDLNGINLRVVEGLLEKISNTDKVRKTWLLYADGEIVGKFYKIEDIKKVIKYIEEKLVK